MLVIISGFQWVILGSFLFTLLPIWAGWKHYNFLPVSLKIVFWFCIVSFLLDAISRVFWIFSIPNLFLGHLSTLVEFFFLANAFRYALGRSISRKSLLIILILFSVLVLVNSLFFQNLQQNNSYIKILEAMLLISFSLMYFYKLAGELKIAYPERDPFFWINTSVFIYFSSSLFVFLYSNYLLLYSRELGIQIWFIHSLFFVFFNFILSIGLWIVPKSSNSPG